MPHNRLVYVSSPYSPFVVGGKTYDTAHNTSLAAKACKFVADQGHCPIAPHLQFPLFLDDNNEEDRLTAFKLNRAILEKCDAAYFFIFKNYFSKGMMLELSHAHWLAAQAAKNSFNYIEIKVFEKREDLSWFQMVDLNDFVDGVTL